MRELDRRTIEEFGTPGEVLMERAGAGATEHILDFAESLEPAHIKRFVLLAGKGNNGGDVYVVARLLAQSSHLPVIIYAVCASDRLSGDAKLNAERLPAQVECRVKEEIVPDDLLAGDIVIDGLLGTGIRGELRSPYGQWIAAVNKSELPVVALDIPSGLNGDSGEFETDAIKADLTVTMGLPKLGMFTGKGPDYCGRLRCVDIGIPEKFIAETGSCADAVCACDVKPFLGRVPMDFHKSSQGRLLVVGGSRKYCGAPFLTSSAALRGGTGYVFTAVPASIPRGISRDYSTIVIEVADGGSGVFTPVSLPVIEGYAEESDAIAFGPGVTREDPVAAVLAKLISLGKPLVIDADGLNLLSVHPSLLPVSGPVVLTPHPGEMARLLKGFGLQEKLNSERREQAKALAIKTQSVVVLKGNRTVISSQHGDIAVNTSGCPALATIGSGDVLTGLIGTFLARGIEPFDAARSAVFIHGLAGELNPYGVRGMIADDLPELIPVAMKQISPHS